MLANSRHASPDIATIVFLLRLCVWNKSFILSRFSYLSSSSRTWKNRNYVLQRTRNGRPQCTTGLRCSNIQIQRSIKWSPTIHFLLTQQQLRNMRKILDYPRARKITKYITHIYGQNDMHSHSSIIYSISAITDKSTTQNFSAQSSLF